jgi:hypothetical protein
MACPTKYCFIQRIVDPNRFACPANQLGVDCIDTADAALRKEPFNPVGRAARDRAYSAASDARAGMYAEAEQRHANRLAAIQRHFGQQITSRGDPDADHALVFVAEVDPAGLWAPIRNRPSCRRLLRLSLRQFRNHPPDC